MWAEKTPSLIRWLQFARPYQTNKIDANPCNYFLKKTRKAAKKELLCRIIAIATKPHIHSKWWHFLSARYVRFLFDIRGKKYIIAWLRPSYKKGFLFISVQLHYNYACNPLFSHSKGWRWKCKQFPYFINFKTNCTQMIHQNNKNMRPW